MMKNLRYLCTFLLLTVLGLGGVKAEEIYSLTPDQSSTGSTATTYITTLTEFTYNGISWKMNQWNPKTLQIKTNQNSAASEFRFYNTSAFAGKIKKVVITFKALTVSDASKLMFLGGTSEVTATTGGTAGTWDSKAKTLTWTPASTDNFTYFAFYQNGKAASGNNYLAETGAIVVTYEVESSGPVTPNVFFANESLEIIKGKSVANAITKPSDLDVTYESSNPSVASVDATTGEVTGVEIGEAVIIVKWNAVDGRYNSGSKSYTVVVRTPTLQELVLLYESWSNSSATQDGSNELGTASSNLDYKNWKELSKVYQGAGQCGKLGTGSAVGKMVTKEIALTGNGTLTFKIKKFKEDTGKLKVSVTGATIVGENQFSPESSSSWTDCMVNLTNGNGEVTITLATTQNRMYIDDIMLAESSAVVVEYPIFSVAPGTYFDAQSVELTCETEGATIKYSSNGENWNDYTSAITIGETTTLYAKAVKGEDESAVVSATYNFPRVYTLGEMNALEKGTYNVKFNNAVVTYVNGSYVFIEDATGAILYYNKNAGMAEKQTLNGIASVTWSPYSGQPEATAINTIDGVTFNTNGTAESVSPTPIAFAELTGDNKDSYISKFVSVEGVTVNDGKLVQGESALAYYGRNNVSLTEGVKYNLIGFLGIYEKDGAKTYQLYLYTSDHVVAYPTAPTFSVEAGEVENGTEVTITAEEGATLKYTVNGTATTAAGNTATVAITEDVTIKAVAVKDGVESEEATAAYTVKAEEPVVEPSTPAEIAAGYYMIKNLDSGKYVNVAGRKTVTFVDEAATATAAGTVIKVESDANGQVKVLRSQGVDIPSYAEKAMRYVPKMVKLVADKLHAEGSGAILGENGLDAIMAKFDESFDEHLYTEEAGEGVRIYGRTPSMQPVVDFYAENKANVDVKLPMLEQFINDAIQKVLQKTGGSGASILVPFSLEMVWEKMGKTLTEPKDEATKLAFLQQVLSNKKTVWDFAYQTAMIYWSKLKNHEKFAEYKDKLGEYAQYIDKIEYIRPDFKYYLVQKNGKIDFISEGNEDILKNNANAIWTLEHRTDFSVAFNEENVLNDKYYTTLYTDFAYTLPEGVKAYKVTEVSEGGVAKKVELEGTIPAQTPVLLESETAEAQTLTLSTEDGTAPKDNLLVGPDALIKQYQIKTAQVESLFDMAKALLGDNAYQNYVAEYEHLMLRNAGTVNNKYFFGLSADDLREVENLRVLGLDNAGENLAFHDIWEKVNANEAFIISEKDPVYLSLVGDVNRDGYVTVADVNALVEIVLGTVTEDNNPNDYDFEAAHVNADDDITIADVTALVNIILGK